MDFLIDGQFVTISQELVLIFDKNTYAWFAMAEGAVEKEREREREKEDITPSSKTSTEKSFEIFLRFCHFFVMKYFSDFGKY